MFINLRYRQKLPGQTKEIWCKGRLPLGYFRPTASSHQSRYFRGITGSQHPVIPHHVREHVNGSRPAFGAQGTIGHSRSQTTSKGRCHLNTCCPPQVPSRLIIRVDHRTLEPLARPPDTKVEPPDQVRMDEFANRPSARQSPPLLLSHASKDACPTAV